MNRLVNRINSPGSTRGYGPVPWVTPVSAGVSPVRAVYATRDNIYTAPPLHIDIKGWYMPVIKMAYTTL